MWLHLDLTRLNQVLIRPVQRGPNINDILPRLKGVKYLTLIEESSNYHNLKLDEQSFYLASFSCPFAGTGI